VRPLPLIIKLPLAELLETPLRVTPNNSAHLCLPPPLIFHLNPFSLTISAPPNALDSPKIFFFGTFPQKAPNPPFLSPHIFYRSGPLLVSLLLPFQRRLPLEAKVFSKRDPSKRPLFSGGYSFSIPPVRRRRGLFGTLITLRYLWFKVDLSRAIHPPPTPFLLVNNCVLFVPLEPENSFIFRSILLVKSIFPPPIIIRGSRDVW